VVAKCGWVNGLAAIRSLGRRGVPVVAVDHHPGAIGFRSRYAAQSLLCPDPLQDIAAFADFMVQLGDRVGPAPIFPTNDELLNAIGQSRAVLGERFQYPFPSWDLLEPLQTKRFQVEQAAAHGIPCPRTGDDPTDPFDFPVLVKPSDPAPFQRAFRTHAFRCESQAELEAGFERARPYAPIVQEFIPGGDDTLYTLGAYIAAGGEALALFCGRKLRQTPRDVGVCRVGEALWVDEVVEQGLRYLRALDYRGLAQIEFKLDRRDGRYKFIEINPRLWQWHGLGTACGVDFVQTAYADLTGLPVEPAWMDRRARRRWAITVAPGERPAVPRPPYTDGLFAHDDPRPALVQVWRLARNAQLVQRSERALALSRQLLRARAHPSEARVR
jgi:D-aspartate ligase